MASRSAVGGAELPARLSDRDFWRMSEPDFSASDYLPLPTTLTSNELGIPTHHSRTGRPDAAGRGRPWVSAPSRTSPISPLCGRQLAIIFDIRRGNMLVQLMYKALFELTKDDFAEFLSMLFLKPRPP